MTTHLVGIDLGSQSAKVVIHDATGTPVCRGDQPLRAPSTPQHGRVEHPDDDLWTALGAASRQAMDAFTSGGGDPGTIAGIGLCGIRFCRAILHRDGSLAAPVLSWMDERVSRPYDPAEHPDAGWVTSSSGYLTHRLTGRFRDSAAAYRGQWPIDMRSWDWLADDTALARFGIPRAQLFELVRPGERLGSVTEDAAAATGLRAGVPVFATANDKAVEALGCGIIRPGQVMVSLGTYIAAMTVDGGHRDTARRSSWTNFASVPGLHLHESTGIRRGMWTVSWLRDLLGEELLSRAAAAGSSVTDLLDDGAATLPPGSDGLLTVLDWLAPAEAPHRRGAMVGFDVRHGPFHLHRSVLEGIAMTMHGHARAMLDELGVRPDRLVLSGGGSRSALMRQVFADVFGMPVVSMRAASAAALGASICAAVGAGVHPGFDPAVDAMVAADVTVAPDEGRHLSYADLEVVHRELSAGIDPALRHAHRLGVDSVGGPGQGVELGRVVGTEDVHRLG